MISTFFVTVIPPTFFTSRLPSYRKNFKNELYYKIYFQDFNPNLKVPHLLELLPGIQSFSLCSQHISWRWKKNNHLLHPGKTRGQTWRQRSCLPQFCFSHPQQLLLVLQRSIHKFPQYQVCKNKNNQAGSTWSYTKSASKSTRLLLRTNSPSSPH